MAGDICGACWGDFDVSSYDSIVVIVSTGVVVVVEVVIDQFFVIAIVVPVGIARVVGDAHAIRTFM